MCDAWLSFKNFYADVGDPPSNQHTLDRINNDGDYEPNNVRWADKYQQAQNSRRAVNIEINGVTKCINAWCRDIGLSYVGYKARRRRGWSIEKAVSTPPDIRRRRKINNQTEEK